MIWGCCGAERLTACAAKHVNRFAVRRCLAPPRVAPASRRRFNLERTARRRSARAGEPRQVCAPKRMSPWTLATTPGASAGRAPSAEVRRTQRTTRRLTRSSFCRARDASHDRHDPQTRARHRPPRPRAHAATAGARRRGDAAARRRGGAPRRRDGRACCPTPRLADSPRNPHRPTRGATGQRSRPQIRRTTPVALSDVTRCQSWQVAGPPWV